MLELETTLSQTTNADAKAKLYYQLASAYYNISFYGNSHMAVDFYRHSSFWNTGTYALDWEKEYYGVVKSSAYYKKAYELSPNKEFKAAAYFLYLKCMQRQLPRPEYDSKMTYQQSMSFT